MDERRFAIALEGLFFAIIWRRKKKKTEQQIDVRLFSDTSRYDAKSIIRIYFGNNNHCFLKRIAFDFNELLLFSHRRLFHHQLVKYFCFLLVFLKSQQNKIAKPSKTEISNAFSLGMIAQVYINVFFFVKQIVIVIEIVDAGCRTTNRTATQTLSNSMFWKSILLCIDSQISNRWRKRCQHCDSSASMQRSLALLPVRLETSFINTSRYSTNHIFAL